LTRCPPHRNCVAARYPRGHRSAIGVCWLPSLDRQPTSPCGVVGYRRCTASVPHLSRETWSAHWRLTQLRYRTSRRRSDPQLASAQRPHPDPRKRRGLVVGVMRNVCPKPRERPGFAGPPEGGSASWDPPKEIQRADVGCDRLIVARGVATPENDSRARRHPAPPEEDAARNQATTGANL